MPYIKREDRKLLDIYIDNVVVSLLENKEQLNGRFNYVISSIISRMFKKDLSGLKQKSKTCLEIVQTLERTADVGWREDKTKWVTLADAEAYARDRVPADVLVLEAVIEKQKKEIAKLTKQLEKVAWYCEDCEEWHAKGMICAVHEVRKMRNGRG